MLAGRTARVIEVLHVLVFIAFFASLPFCFQVMPLDAEAEAKVHCDDYLFNVSVGDSCGHVDQIASAIETRSEVSSPLDADKDVKDCDRGSSKLSLVSFLIALIGGGVFSLEAFEAFPML
eukprot:gb/GFBE01073055.1/.p1 GENE.gb/GFBE01073055.1/~~gb/GFBE01073055.1/.p1  ORF type:complete len:120 (+),score=24.41 gb/GFBE01073055.1/:1-360(+)